MTYEEMLNSIDHAKEIINWSERLAKRSLEILIGRLRYLSISAYVLSNLKRELRKWDMHKCRWKD